MAEQGGGEDEVQRKKSQKTRRRTRERKTLNRKQGWGEEEEEKEDEENGRGDGEQGSRQLTAGPAHWRGRKRGSLNHFLLSSPTLCSSPPTPESPPSQSSFTLSKTLSNFSSGKEEEEERERSEKYSAPAQGARNSCKRASCEQTFRSEADLLVEMNLSVTSPASSGAGASAGGGSSEPRRRSVHFDACPTTLIVEDASIGASAAVTLAGVKEDQESYDGDTESDLLSPAVVKAHERRKSAPASAIRDAGGPASGGSKDDFHSVAMMSDTLKALDPELRRSLTKLCATPLEEPQEDMDLVNFKLLGRDELEIRRLKQKQNEDAVRESLGSASSEDHKNSSEELAHMEVSAPGSPPRVVICGGESAQD